MPRSYVDNAYNRSVGRVGMPVGSMVISSGSSFSSSSRSTSCSSYGSSGHESSGYFSAGSSPSSTPSSRTYADNASNRRLGRAGEPMGSMPVSKGSSSSESTSTKKPTYADNASNRILGRAGEPMGSMPVSKGSSSSDSTSTKKPTYADNASNRRLGRAGEPMGSMPVSKGSSSSDSTSTKKPTYADNASNRRLGRAGEPMGSMPVSKGSSSSDSISTKEKTYADNAANRRLGRAGEPMGSMPVSKGSSSSDSISTKEKTYADNAANRKLGRAGEPMGSMPVSKGSFGRGSDSNVVRVYKDNPMNRKLGRVGKTVGSFVVSTPGIFRELSQEYYTNNALNRSLGRAGMPKGCMPNSRVSRQTENVQKMIKNFVYYPHIDLDMTDIGFAEAEMDLTAGFLNRQLEELTLRENDEVSKIHTSRSLLANYSGVEIQFEEIQLGRKIGQGGFGDVHFAKWKHTVVAVKKLRVQRVSKRRLADFTKEVMTFCQLDDPNIVKFVGACLTTPNLCIVMEYMQISLFEALHMRQDIDFSEDERLDIIQQICSGLKYLHGNSISHCDLKSQNILLDYEAGKSCIAKITDFGLSMIKSNTESSVCSTDEQVRNIGTPRYSAPEVLRGEIMSARSMRKADIYSLALIVYEVIYEEEPFYKLGYAQLQKQVGGKGLTPAIQEDPEVIEDVYLIMRQCWQFDPIDRPSIGRVARVFNRQKKLYLTE